MLHEYLGVLYRDEQEKVASAAFVEKLKALPADELQELASGQLNKLASYFERNASWLDSYKGTPLIDSAIDIEKRLLEIDQKLEVYRDKNKINGTAMDRLDDERTKICLEKRLLDLELAKLDPQTSAADNQGEKKEAFIGAAAKAIPALAKGLPRAGQAIAAGGRRLGMGAGKAINKIPAAAASGTGSRVARGVSGTAGRLGQSVQQGGVAGGLSTAGRQAANWARQNPLAAAGVAGGAGLMAGRMTS